MTVETIGFTIRHKCMVKGRGLVERLYPRSRPDALSDAVFGVAVTLLVLDVRLPEEFHPSSAWELVHRLSALWPKLFHWSIYSPRDVLWAYLLNAAAPAISRVQRGVPATRNRDRVLRAFHLRHAS